MSNVGKWDRWYSTLEDEPQPYADTQTYALAADFVKDCSMVEDWGCGKGWLRKFIPEERYIGIDGSHSPFADQIVDLAEYRSAVPGIVIRHVLEHDYRWHLILENALASAQDRLCLVVYSPLSSYTKQIDFEEDPGVPVLSFRKEDILARFTDANFTVDIKQVAGKVNFGLETIFLGSHTKAVL